MNSSSTRPRSDDPEQRLEELLDEWEAQVQRGRSPQPSDLCRDCPEMIFPLTRAIRQLQQMDHLMVPDPPDSVSEPLPDRIGPFEVVSELGRGGMGVVYSCRQTGTSRQIAVKVLRPDPGTDDSGRFRREMLTAGSIADPGIVHIYDAGVDESGPIRWRWIAMEQIDGVHLNAYVARERLGQREIIALVLRVCQSVAALHQKGIIHQDLKPSNILVDRNGRPQIVDFGIAAALDEQDEVQLSETQITFGTLPYLPPEALDETDASLDVRTDIFGLGVILFELLTDNSVRKWHETTKLVREDHNFESRWQWMQTESRALPNDLRQIVLKAVHPNRNRRYSSVDALCSDLERYCEGCPVEAAPAGPIRRTWKWCRRNRLVSLTAGTGLLLLVGWITDIRTMKERFEEQRELIFDRTLQLDGREWQIARNEENSAYSELQNTVDQTPQLTLERLETLGSGETRDCLAWRLLHRRADWQELAIPDAADISHTELSPAGDRLATHSPTDGIRVYDLDDEGTPGRRYGPYPNGAVWLGASPDLHHFLLLDRPAVCLRMESQDRPGVLPVAGFGEIACGDISPDGTLLALGLTNGALIVCRPDGSELQQWPAQRPHCRWLSWDDPASIVACSADGTVRIINPQSFPDDRVIRLTERFPDVRRISRCDFAVGPRDEPLLLLGRREKSIFSFQPHSETVKSYQFLGSELVGLRMLKPNDVVVASRQRLSALSLADNRPAWSWRTGGAEILALAVAADGQRMAVALDDDTLRVLRTTPRPWSVPLTPPDSPGPSQHITALVPLDSIGHMLTLFQDGSLAVWDLAKGTLEARQSPDWPGVRRFAARATDDGSILVCLQREHDARILRLPPDPDQSAILLYEHPSRVSRAAFHPDDDLCLLGLPQGRLLLCNPETGQVDSLPGHRSRITAISRIASLDGWITGDDEGRVVFRDADGRVVRSLAAHSARVTQIIVHDRRVLTASRDGVLSAWTLDGQLLDQTHEHDSGITAMAVSPDGMTLVTADRSTRLCLRDPLTLHVRLSIREPPLSVTRLHFAGPHSLVSQGYDGSRLCLWGERPGRDPSASPARATAVRPGPSPPTGVTNRRPAPPLGRGSG